MANDVQTGSEASVTTLVSGILKDSQELFKQQLALFQAEIKSDLRKTLEAGIAMAAGAGLAVLGTILLAFMLVHLLHWAVPDVPLWGWYGIVGGALALTGAALVFLGKKKLESFNPLPDQSVETMKENLQWIMKPR